jgi:hypothetical protein
MNITNECLSDFKDRLDYDMYDDHKINLKSLIVLRNEFNASRNKFDIVEVNAIKYNSQSYDKYPESSASISLDTGIPFSSVISDSGVWIYFTFYSTKHITGIKNCDKILVCYEADTFYIIVSFRLHSRIFI